MTRLADVTTLMGVSGQPFVRVEAQELAALLASGTDGFGCDVRNITRGCPAGRFIVFHDATASDPGFRWLATSTEAAVQALEAGDRLELQPAVGQPIPVVVTRAWQRSRLVRRP